MSYEESLKMEFIKWGLTLITLIITWGLGQLIIYLWDKRKKERELALSDVWDEKKKRRELDMAAVNQFQRFYGEFKTIWRLVRTYHNSFKAEEKNKLPQPTDADYIWKLMDRASKVEGDLEALLVKVATERRLNDTNANDLGLYRQACQKLREAIKKGKSEYFQRDSEEYYLFDELSCEFLKILSFNELLEKNDVYEQTASAQYHKIKDVGGAEWNEAVATKGAELKAKLEKSDR